MRGGGSSAKVEIISRKETKKKNHILQMLVFKNMPKKKKKLEKVKSCIRVNIRNMENETGRWISTRRNI